MARAVIVVLGVALILSGLFVLLRPDAPAGGPANRTIDVSVEGGEMSPSEISVNEGDSVTIGVTSDAPIELHLHGYDVEQEIEPNREAELRFEADLTGRFAIEDHESGAELGVLQVRPR